MKASNKTPVERAFIHHVMFTKGIVPLEDVDGDVRRALKDLSPEDARTFKRKFRKIWRQYVKKSEKLRGRAKLCGLGSKEPTKNEKHARKALVYHEIWTTQIYPMLEAFKKIKHPTKEVTTNEDNPETSAV